tara:strand:- start:236 stop:613 length:378 start_codon:yes stop_codon:yes gene_type:complete
MSNRRTTRTHGLGINRNDEEVAVEAPANIAKLRICPARLIRPPIHSVATTNPKKKAAIIGPIITGPYSVLALSDINVVNSPFPIIISIVDSIRADNRRIVDSAVFKNSCLELSVDLAECTLKSGY